MIINYDRNPNLTTDQKLDSLIESIMLALNEKADYAEMQSTTELLQGADKKTEKSIEAIQAAPHVIETGTHGIWTWRKWSDGTAECWGTFYKTVSIAAGGQISAGIGAFPNIFVARPIATVCGGGTANPNIFASYSNAYSTSGGYGLDAYWRNLSGSAFNNQAWMDIHVIGRWK